VPGRESGLTGSGELVKRKTTMIPEPKDKLDAASTLVGVANGPQGATLDWHAVDWRACEQSVRRLRQRIFTASQAGDLPRVRRLQKLMLRSRSNALLSVRRVTERNAGRLTAGVDGEVVLSPEAKMKLVDRIQRQAEPFTAMPVRRVYIPKAGSSSKPRPLGIPVIADRCHQARIVNALEPEWEARFEPKSYGFRPGRGCHDAIAAVYQVSKGKNPRRRWVLDADLAGAFDRIAHDHILSMLGTFPARGIIRQWLKAGVIENGRLSATEDGVPQGGVVSPVLLNVALHGMEQAAGVRYRTTGRHAGTLRPDSPTLVRYADDMVALCRTRDEALQIKAQLAEWLAPRGLAFNEDKTRVVSLDDGFDFLGFNARRYNDKLLTKPSKAAQRRVRERLRREMRSLRGANARTVIVRLNPIIRGWAAYYRIAVSSEVFASLDDYMWKLAYKWSRHSHPNKSGRWVAARYFGMFNKARRDRWVFGDRNSGAYLHKFAWTLIVRHPMVPSAASPDDPALAAYWANRRRKTPLPIDKTTRWLLAAQDGRCSICTGTLLPVENRPQTPHEWEQWLATTRKTITTVAIRTVGTPDENTPRLIHANCRRQPTRADGSPVLLSAYAPSALA
jgi:RNA-directed DNA polymerase